ncbi:VOC family protein [bacterium]|nr:VOC family protein [bacterium]
MGNPVVHFEIAWKDQKGAIDFYSKLFDWKITFMEEMEYGGIDTGTAPGGGIMGAKDFPPYVTFYVEVDDVDDYLKKAEGMGSKVIMPKMAIPETGDVAAFQDPEGVMIGLYKPVKKQ